MLLSLTRLLMTVMLAEVVRGEKCQHPAPAPGYTNTLYSGRWYEVGKYQTLGGSIFQQGTVCTIATFQPYSLAEGGGDIGESIYSLSYHQHNHRNIAGYSSRKHEPSGSWSNATGTLAPMELPGHFSQTLNFGGFEGPAVDYNVVWLDEDTAIE